MAGPVIAALGPFAFEAHGFGLQAIDRNLATPWASVEVASRFDRLQWIGGKGEDVHIPGLLFPMEFGGANTLEGIRSAAKAGQPLHLVQLSGAMSGDVLGLMAIQGVSDKKTYIAPNGVALKNTYTISMKLNDGSSFGFMSVLGGLS